jgi:hypothetical protein
MMALLAAAAILTATSGTSSYEAQSTDDQQLVALTVTAIRGCRKLEILGFTIYRGYAMGGWTCVESGGYVVGAKWEGRWARLTSGGGAMNARGPEGHYVPTDIANVLMAPCPPGHAHPLTGAQVAAGATVCTP